MADRMSMMELQTVMGNNIRKLENTEMTAEEREITLEHAKAVEKMAKQMINNGRFILDAEKLQAQIGVLTKSKAVELIGD